MANSSPLRAFAHFAQDKPGIDPDVVETLVQFKKNYLGDDDPTLWNVADLSELLLGFLPRKVVADEEWFAAVVPTMRLFVTFLQDRAQLHPRSDRPADLLAELDRLGKQMVHASQDPRNFGVSKSIFSAVGAVPKDAATLQSIMEAFNSLPYDQRKAITDPTLSYEYDEDEYDEDDYGEDDYDEDEAPFARMPPTWIPPASELAEAAQSTPLFGQLQQLTEWVRPRRPLTKRNLLPVAAAREACGHLDLPVPDIPKPRSLRDLPRLYRIWKLAIDSGFIDVSNHAAVPGRIADEAGGIEPEELLGRWSVLLGNCLEWGLDLENDELVNTDPHAVDVLVEEVDQLTIAILGELYAGAQASLPALGRALAETADEFHHSHRDNVILTNMECRQVVGRRWAAQLVQLLELGVVDRGREADEDDELVMTALGRATFRQLLLEADVDAPLLDDPADLDVCDLLDALDQLADPIAESLLTAWLATRTPDDATADLLVAARTGTAVIRLAALTLLTEYLAEHLRVAGRAQIEPLHDDPLLWPYADLLLSGENAALTPAQRQWMTFDSVAVAIETGDLDDPETADEVWEAVTAFADLESAWRCQHPELTQILEVIARAHPTGRVRKAAKKALFKARQQPAQA
jgi:hypothetical protein